MTDQLAVVEEVQYWPETILPLTIEQDGAWLEAFLSYPQTVDSLIELNTRLADPVLSDKSKLYDLGVLQLDDSRTDKVLLRGEHPNTFSVIALIRVLSSRGISPEKTRDEKPLLFKKPLEVLTLLREAENQGNIGNSTEITVDWLVAGLSRFRKPEEPKKRRTSESAPKTLREPRDPNTLDSENPQTFNRKTRELSPGKKALLDDPSNSAKIEELILNGYDPARCLINYRAKPYIIDAAYLNEVRSTMINLFPEINLDDLNTLVPKVFHNRFNGKTIGKNIILLDEGFAELSSKLADGMPVLYLPGVLDTDPSITAHKPDTVINRLQQRSGLLEKTGMNMGRIIQLVNNGALSLTISDARFNFGLEILKQLHPSSVNTESNYNFRDLFSLYSSPIKLMFGALQIPDLTKVDLTGFFTEPRHFLKEGGTYADAAQYVTNNRHRVTGSPAHQKLLKMYDELMVNKQRSDIDDADSDVTM